MQSKSFVEKVNTLFAAPEGSIDIKASIFLPLLSDPSRGSKKCPSKEVSNGVRRVAEHSLDKNKFW
jgi:hypothetical protein